MSSLLDGSKGGFVIIDYVISALAIFGNCLVLEGVIREHFGLTLIGYRHFLISLSISDLYICGVCFSIKKDQRKKAAFDLTREVNLAMFIHNAMISAAPVTQLNDGSARCYANALRSFQLVGYFANLFNLCGISIEHYAGTMHPMRYRVVMSKKVARMVVGIVWTLAIILGVLDVPITAIAFYSSVDYNSSNGSGNYHTEPPPFWLNGSRGDLTIEAINNLFINSPATFSPSPTPIIANNYRQSIAKASGLNVSGKNDAPFLLTGINATSRPPKDSDEMDEEISQLEMDLLFESLFGQNGAVNESAAESTLRGLLIDMRRSRSPKLNWCTYHSIQQFWLEITVMALTLFCFAFLIVCYGIIFKKVFQTATSLKRRTAKLTVTTALFLASFAICWLPMMINELVMLWYLFQSQRGKQSRNNNNAMAMADQFSSTSILIHSAFNTLLISYPLIDPIIYAARIPAIKRRIFNHFLSLLPCVRRCIKQNSAIRTSSRGGFRSFDDRALSRQRSQPATDAVSIAYSPSIDMRNSNNLNPNEDEEVLHLNNGVRLTKSGSSSRRFSLPEDDVASVNCYESVFFKKGIAGEEGSNSDGGDVALLIGVPRCPINRPNNGHHHLTIGRCLSADCGIISKKNRKVNHREGDGNNMPITFGQQKASFRRTLPTLEYTDGAET